MRHHRSIVRLTIRSAVALAIACSTVLFRTELIAQEARRTVVLSGGRGQATPTPPPPAPTPRPTVTPVLTMSQMKGSWTAALSGFAGCGQTTEYWEFTLDEFGRGTQSVHSSHTNGCGDNTASGYWVILDSLNPDGTGFIGFECGDSCGFWFTIQVSRNREMFNMSAEHVGGNYLAGVAVRR
jgi:hypothetical protein